MNEYNKDLALILIICLVGVTGSFFDYLTEELLIPFTLYEINEVPEHMALQNEDKINRMNSSWFLFTLFGVMLALIKIGGFKSKYKGKKLIKYLWSNYVKRKINEGKIETYNWRRRIRTFRPK